MLRVIKAAIRETLSKFDRRVVLRKRAEEQFYRKIIGENRDLIFDIGANCGDKAAIFAKLAKRVVCVEPGSDAVHALRRRFRRNPKIAIIPKGVGESDAPRQFHQFMYSGFNAVNPRLVEARHPELEKISVSTIPMTTLDSLIQEFGMPFYIKIDVEGHESAVLHGLSQRVPLISFECILPEFGEETKQCIERLKKMAPAAVFNYTLEADPPTKLEREAWMPAAKMMRIVSENKFPYLEIYCISRFSAGQPIQA
jgi:FkbM family methyltransferase